MNAKRRGNSRNINPKLLALISTLLFSTAAVAADTVKQDGTTQNSAASGPAVHESAKVGSSAASPAKKRKKLPYYAKVGDIYINWIDYNNEYATEARKKFYHGKPSDDAIAAFQRQIGDTLVTNAMLVQEAKRRKIKPDEAFVKEQLDQYEQRFAKNPNWPAARPRVLPILTERMQNANLRSKLEEQVRNVPDPSKKQLRKYYADHQDKFTAPPATRVSVILIKVDPGAPDTDWQKASEQAQDLVKRARAGEDFAELAREYSGDKTAADGGDMGYLHEGMLPGLPAETVGKLQPGETSDPVKLMEGVGIFRLVERHEAKVNSFEASEPRAKELWLKEQSDNAWNSLIAKLKKNTPVEVDESHFLPLPAVAENAADDAKNAKP
ncbi:MAG: peptidylprolyl isomerase [Gallionella sp.]